jgi:hypothetical protein
MGAAKLKLIFRKASLLFECLFISAAATLLLLFTLSLIFSHPV